LRSARRKRLNMKQNDGEERGRTPGLVRAGREEEENDDGEDDGRGTFYKKEDLEVLNGWVGDASDAVSDETTREEGRRKSVNLVDGKSTEEGSAPRESASERTGRDEESNALSCGERERSVSIKRERKAETNRSRSCDTKR
jgi:hypothetical protein